MSNISFYDVVNKLEETFKLPSGSEKRLLPEHYIFDENQSVKWNKEQVERHNKEKREEDLQFRVARTKAIDIANGFAGEYLAQEYGISKNVGVKVFLFAKRETDSFFDIASVLDHAEDICELFKEDN